MRPHALATLPLALAISCSSVDSPPASVADPALVASLARFPSAYLPYKTSPTLRRRNGLVLADEALGTSRLVANEPMLAVVAQPQRLVVAFIDTDESLQIAWAERDHGWQKSPFPKLATPIADVAGTVAPDGVAHFVVRQLDAARTLRHFAWDGTFLVDEAVPRPSPIKDLWWSRYCRDLAVDFAPDGSLDIVFRHDTNDRASALTFARRAPGATTFVSEQIHTFGAALPQTPANFFAEGGCRSSLTYDDSGQPLVATLVQELPTTLTSTLETGIDTAPNKTVATFGRDFHQNWVADGPTLLYDEQFFTNMRRTWRGRFMVGRSNDGVAMLAAERDNSGSVDVVKMKPASRRVAAPPLSSPLIGGLAVKARNLPLAAAFVKDECGRLFVREYPTQMPPESMSYPPGSVSLDRFPTTSYPLQPDEPWNLATPSSCGDALTAPVVARVDEPPYLAFDAAFSHGTFQRYTAAVCAVPNAELAVCVGAINRQHSLIGVLQMGWGIRASGEVRGPLSTPIPPTNADEAIASTLPVRLLTSVPADGAIVAATTSITVNVSSDSPLVAFDVMGADGWPVETQQTRQVTPAGTTITLTPTAPLKSGRRYRVAPRRIYPQWVFHPEVPNAVFQFTVEGGLGAAQDPREAPLRLGCGTADAPGTIAADGSCTLPDVDPLLDATNGIRLSTNSRLPSDLTADQKPTIALLGGGAVPQEEILALTTTPSQLFVRWVTHPLRENADYTLTIPATLTNIYGQPTAADTRRFSFHTRPYPLHLVESVPASLAVVATDTVVRLRFNQPISSVLQLGNGAVLTAAGDPTPVALSWLDEGAGSYRATHAPLRADTAYALNVPLGAISSLTTPIHVEFRTLP